MLKCDKGYGGFELAILRNGGTDITGPFRRKSHHGINKFNDYLTFKHDGRKFIMMFYVDENPMFLWLTEVQHEHGVKHPSFDTTLGYKGVKTHLIPYKNFITMFPSILNMSHENEEGQPKAADQ